MENTLASLRDAAMIRLMSDCLLRVSEVVAVNVEDLKEKTLTLRSSKSDQEGTGESLYVCDTTRDVLDRYRERADITDGAMFQHIRRGDHIQPNRIIAHSARRIIKKRAADAGVKGFISGHSLRVGLLSRLHKPVRSLSICKSQEAGNQRRCQHTTPKQNSQNEEQSHDSRTANGNLNTQSALSY